MRRNLVCILFIASLGVFAGKQPKDIAKNIDKQEPQTISFTENKGQVSDQFYKPRPDVLFYGSANGLVYHIKNNGISYQLSRVDSWKESDQEHSTLLKGLSEKGNRVIAQKKSRLIPDQITLYRVDINWLNTNKSPAIQIGAALPGYNNFYTSSCPNGALYVKSYNDLTLKNIYNGIDIHYYDKDGQLEYDYVIAAGADHTQIQFNIEGAESIVVNSNGELVVKTPHGEIVEKAPLVKQGQTILPSQWLVKNKTISFKINNVNPNQSLIIDPAVVVRAWGTYYGGAKDEYVEFSSIDASGNVNISGSTSSIETGVIASNGSYQNILGGQTDNFVVKFDPNGLRLWGTYYGGTGFETIASTATDVNGNIFLFGTTSSTNAIVTGGCYQSTQPIIGGADTYLVKLNSNGIRQWGTYYGGSGNENSWNCASDQQGNVYLNGYVDGNSGSTLASLGCHQSLYGGGMTDLFIAKFDPNGIRLWGTYYGGNLFEGWGGFASDAIGNVYLSGQTASQNGTSIASIGGYQSSHGDNTNSGAFNAFLVKFNTNGVRQWGTYYGSNVGTGSRVCASDNNGNVYLAGYTFDTIVIATQGCHQPELLQGAGYLAKFNSSGNRIWGTYYGGLGGQDIYGCIIDNSNNVYISGNTDSLINSTRIATIGSHQPIFGGGGSDAFAAKFNSNGVRQWGTYYGGNKADYDWDMEVHPATGSIYIVGETSSANGTTIATANSLQPIWGGGVIDTLDAFVAKLFDCSISMVSNCVGIEELENDFIKLNIFPNPSNGEFTITAKQNLQLNIITELGQVIQTINLEEKNNYASSVINLSSGIYFITSNNGYVKEKIVVIR